VLEEKFLNLNYLDDPSIIDIRLSSSSNEILVESGPQI